MLSLIPFKIQVHLDKAHCYLDDGEVGGEVVTKVSVLCTGVHELKAHEQIIYRSISHFTKLLEVRQL